MKKLNLGCGPDIRIGYINVDIEPENKNVKHIDLNKLPYPFKDNTFTEVIAFNILEHLNDPYEVLKELHRICKDKALIKIATPHFSSGNAWADIQHRKPFSYRAFHNINLLDKFNVNNFKITFPFYRLVMKWFANKFPGFYEYNLAYIFPSSDIYVELEVKK